MDAKTVIRRWWGDYAFEVGQNGYWHIGPMKLWLQRLSGEWRVAHESVNDPFATEVQIDVPCDTADCAPASGVFHRYFLRKPLGRAYLHPLLADRTVVSRPEMSIHLPPGEQVTLFVSSPIWLRIDVGDPRVSLCEVPVFRPSDTWFGPTTRDGGHSYASTTLALTSLEDFPFSPFRAITPLNIRNRAESMLTVERLNLPVPFLSLYQSQDGSLWTQAVTMDRDEDDEELAVLKLGKGAPDHAGHAVLVTAPRKKAGKNLVFHAFSALFNGEH